MHHRQSPFTALALLLMFKRQHRSMTEAEYDLCFQTIVQFLEEVNDEKYRLEQSNVSTQDQ